MTTKTDYKTLPDATGNKSAVTIATLATEFSISSLKVSEALKAAGIAPIGKLPVMKDGKPSVGKPTFAFDGKEARQAVSDTVVQKTAA
jgi:hypothetical protein